MLRTFLARAKGVCSVLARQENHSILHDRCDLPQSTMRKEPKWVEPSSGMQLERVRVACTCSRRAQMMLRMGNPGLGDRPRRLKDDQPEPVCKIRRNDSQL